MQGCRAAQGCLINQGLQTRTNREGILTKYGSRWYVGTLGHVLDSLSHMASWNNIPDGMVRSILSNKASISLHLLLPHKAHAVIGPRASSLP
jgi:hypothetical protein